MADHYGVGRGIAQKGGTATPKQSTYQAQQKIDAGFNSVRNEPRPVLAPRPSSTTRR